MYRNSLLVLTYMLTGAEVLAYWYKSTTKVPPPPPPLAAQSVPTALLSLARPFRRSTAPGYLARATGAYMYVCLHVYVSVCVCVCV